MRWLLGLVVSASVLTLAGAATAQSPGLPSSSVALSVSVEPPTGAPNRTLALTASGEAEIADALLYVSWDTRRSRCPAVLEDLPNEGGWALVDPLAGVYRVGAGGFSVNGTLSIPPGFIRFCTYLTDEFDVPLATHQTQRLIPADPAAPLTRPVVIDSLLRSPRVHREVKGWIRQGERNDEPGLGLNGPGYIRFADVTGDGRADAIAQPSAGGAGRVHAYYIVTNHGGAVRVVAAARRAFNATIQPRGRGYREIIPRYAARDGLCCASTRSVRVLRWNGTRFVQVSRRIVRTRYWTPTRRH
jgi:hypothetical protein